MVTYLQTMPLCISLPLCRCTMNGLIPQSSPLIMVRAKTMATQGIPAGAVGGMYLFGDRQSNSEAISYTPATFMHVLCSAFARCVQFKLSIRQESRSSLEMEGIQAMAHLR